MAADLCNDGYSAIHLHIIWTFQLVTTTEDQNIYCSDADVKKNNPSGLSVFFMYKTKDPY